MVGVEGDRSPPGCRPVRGPLGFLVTANDMLLAAALGSVEWFQTKPCREKVLQLTPSQACRRVASRAQEP